MISRICGNFFTSNIKALMKYIEPVTTDKYGAAFVNNSDYNFN
jgi:hypothetical protein